jgi:dephospho-CoA kinase
MLVVALTGGIGSGKSTVARIFAELGAPVIDADLVAREVVAPGSPALAEIGSAFGPEVLDDTGRLHRENLREMVFSDAAARRRLESIMHPRIRETMVRRLSDLDAPYAILVIPLLLETGQNELGDRTLVVDLPESLQIERVKQRDRLEDARIKTILAAQCDRSTRLSAADDVIDNQGDAEKLREQVEKLHRRYVALADTR